MSRRRGCGALLVLVATGSLVLTESARARQALQDPAVPAFRSGASAIAVDVTVRDRSRRAMTGLTAADFQVFDNGVLQRVDSVSYDRLPIDVTIALDVSYSVTGALLERLRDGVVQLMGDLGPQDRLKLVLFNMKVHRAIDYTTDVKAVERAIRGAVAGGGTALLDAVSVTLVSASVPDRRQLIVFFTDGSDTSSTTPADVLPGIAQRTRATLTFVTPLPAKSGTVASGTTQVLLSALARETGGSILHAGPATNLSAAFRRALSEFRSAYVLYYTARGVDRPGYHALEVKVNRDGAEVQARRGYFGS